MDTTKLLIPFIFLIAFGCKKPAEDEATPPPNSPAVNFNDNTWNSLDGPYSTGVSELAVSSNAIYAGSGPLYKSTDNGATWSDTHCPLLSITGLGTLGNKVFAGDNRNTWGMYVSGDGGSTWTQEAFFTSFAISSITTDNGKLYVGTHAGLFLSTDSGSTWNNLNTIAIHSIAANGNVILVGNQQGISYSSDGGQTWNASTGFGYDPFIRSIAFCGSKAFATAVDGGIYLSIDNGASWTNVNVGRTIKAHSLAVNGNIIYCGTNIGVYVSIDAGVLWENKSSGIVATEITCMAMQGNNVFAGSYASLYYSSDNAFSWKIRCKGMGYPFSSGITSIDNNIFVSTQAGLFQLTSVGWSLQSTLVYPLLVSVFNDNGTLIVGGYNTMYVSTDKALSWGMVNMANLSSYVRKGNIIFIISDFVYASYDNGNTWLTCPGGQLFYTLTALGVFKSNLFLAADQAIYKSVDNGLQWIRSTNGFSSNGRAFTSKNSRLFVGSDDGVFISDDEGQLWKASNNGLTSLKVYDIMAAGQYVFAATDIGVFFSTDDGNSWQGSTGLNTFTTKLYSDGQKLYVTTKDKGVFSHPL